MVVELNPALKPVAFLLGIWNGEGAGQYPTVQPFRYREEIRFSHTGKTFLVYTQRTEAIDDGRALHAEMGYLRMVGEDRAELVVAQPIGYAEIEVGRVKGTRLDLESIQVARTPTAKPVTGLARSFWLEGETLRYEVRMAMSDGPLVLHLKASFHRAAN